MPACPHCGDLVDGGKWHRTCLLVALGVVATEMGAALGGRS